MRPSYVVNACGSRSTTTAAVVAVAAAITVATIDVAVNAITLGASLGASVVVVIVRMLAGIEPCYRLVTFSIGMSSIQVDLDLLKH